MKYESEIISEEEIRNRINSRGEKSATQLFTEEEIVFIRNKPIHGQFGSEQNNQFAWDDLGLSIDCRELFKEIK